MSDPRIAGLMLMGVSIAALMGTTRGDLPSLTFFPALILLGLGAIKFLRTNREAMDDRRPAPKTQHTAFEGRSQSPEIRGREIEIAWLKRN